MKYLSVCSGIEAASVDWHDLGWEPVAFSEIEPFPSSLLAHRFPNVPNLGDMTKFKEWPIERGTVDLLVGGTPCQSFSVAGLRRGLEDPRGNLMLTFGAIADHFRPTWIVWENVPGVLSSNGGRDFGSFLGMLGELGYGVAYRVLDAQFFGVAQRRRRVFVVGYLGDWRRAASVLFESESLSGNPPPSRETGEDPARSLRARANASHREDSDNYVPVIAGTLNASMAGMNRPAGQGNELDFCIPVAHTLRARGFDASEDGTGRGTPLVPVAIRTAQTSANGHGIAAHVAHTLDSANGQAVVQPMVPVSFHNRQDPDVSGDITHPIGAKDNGLGAMVGSAVRRLTPRECERLQGFPDDWTLVPWRGKLAPDGPRYKACGNSMAVPIMRWIGKRIEAMS